jgi:hypothetical protein
MPDSHDYQSSLLAGHPIKPDGRGVYRCPNHCGRPGSPALKWKTEAGFLKHLRNCPKDPVVMAARMEAEKKQRDEEERRYSEALAVCPHKIGERIMTVCEFIIKATHDSRGRRVRYEEVKEFRGGPIEIASIYWNGAQYIYNGLNVRAICETLEDARAKAGEMQNSWDEHVAHSQFCR